MTDLQNAIVFENLFRCFGKNDEVARAVADWSLAYADVSEQDYRDFLNAG